MKKKYSATEILEKLKWYHGESFTTEILKDEFIKMLEKEQNNEA